MQTKFARDLERGQYFEKKMSPYILPDEVVCYAPKGVWSQWDISGVKFTYEVKTDFMCRNTGNIYFECMSNGKPSGFLNSEAEFFLFVVVKPNNTKFGDVDRVFKIPTLDILTIVNGKQLIRGGDRGLSRGYLVKPSEIEKYEVKI